MTRHSTASRKPYSASNALEAIATALREIKHEDGLTYHDLGAALGKSDDQAAKYADGTATMDFITFGRARREWGTRFTCHFDQLCGVPSIPGTDDRAGQSRVLRAALVMSEAMEDNGVIDLEEVRAHRKAFAQAFDAIGEQLQKLECGA